MAGFTGALDSLLQSLAAFGAALIGGTTGPFARAALESMPCRGCEWDRLGTKIKVAEELSPRRMGN